MKGKNRHMKLHRNNFVAEMETNDWKITLEIFTPNEELIFVIRYVTNLKKSTW